MENILTAAQARDITTNGQKTLLEKCVAKIKSDAENGSTASVFWTWLKNEKEDKPAISDLSDKLRELGYSINIEWSTSIKEYKLIIKW